MLFRSLSPSLLPPHPSSLSFSSYGTVLYINTVEYTPDGRSLITTTGEKRFKVTQKGTIDGYSTAKIQFIVDEPVTDQEEIGTDTSLTHTVP